MDFINELFFYIEIGKNAKKKEKMNNEKQMNQFQTGALFRIIPFFA